MSIYFLGHLALRALGFAFAAVAGIWVFRSFRRRNDPALAALERRLVSGDIGDEEFRRIRDILESR